MFKKYSSKEIFFISLSFAIAFSVGILIGVLAIRNNVANIIINTLPEEDEYVKNPNFSKRLLKEINKENIRQHVRELSKLPKVAGSENGLKVGQRIAQLWREYKLDTVNVVPYNVLLTYPKKDNPNKVIFYKNNQHDFDANLTEKPFTADENVNDVLPAFVAFTKSGTVQGKVFYANYGTVDDFKKLKELNVNCTGNIALIRYGKIFRAQKITHAEQAGAIGVLLYLDPDDVAPFGTNEQEVYPYKWWLPGTGIQRGTTSSMRGDQLTQGYPSVDYAFRPEIDDIAHLLSKIPAQPISYNDAEKLLQRIGGPLPPKNWTGALNVSYSLGPEFIDEYENSSVKLEVNNEYVMKEIHNIIGIIHGDVEPDRYVILGNHHDSWSYGAVDPTSGTGILLELVRVFGKFVQEGWRPRRSLVFCSWDAEEFGLIGSYEWVEENVKVLFNRAVVYLNVDYGARGNFSLQGRANSIIRKALIHSSMKVEDPYDSSKTVHDTWKTNNPLDENNDPIIPGMGSGSDFLPFIQAAAIPALDIRYTYNTALKTSTYPTYHTMYEVFYYLDTFIDQGFHCHLALARVWAELANYFSTSLILPFDPTDYAKDLLFFYKNVNKTYGTILQKENVTLDHLLSSIHNFTYSSKKFIKSLTEINFTNPLEIRILNDQLMNVEKAFYYPIGLMGRPEMKHLIFAPSSHDSYVVSNFPGLSDLLFDVDSLEDKEKIQRWKDIKKHLTVITHAVQSAADILKSHKTWTLARTS